MRRPHRLLAKRLPKSMAEGSAADDVIVIVRLFRLGFLQRAGFARVLGAHLGGPRVRAVMLPAQQRLSPIGQSRCWGVCECWVLGGCEVVVRRAISATLTSWTGAPRNLEHHHNLTH